MFCWRTNDHSAIIISKSLNVLGSSATKAPAGERKSSKMGAEALFFQLFLLCETEWEGRVPKPSTRTFCPPQADDYPGELQADVNPYYRGGRGLLTLRILKLLDVLGLSLMPKQ